MSLDYATLTRTASGALTAASKRALAAEKAEQEAAWRAKSKKQEAFRQAFYEFDSATEDYESAGGINDMQAQTVREERIVGQAVSDARQEWEADYREDVKIEVAAAIDDQIHRLYVLGLDTEMSTLEVLERLRDRVAA